MMNYKIDEHGNVLKRGFFGGWKVALPALKKPEPEPPTPPPILKEDVSVADVFQGLSTVYELCATTHSMVQDMQKDVKTLLEPPQKELPAVKDTLREKMLGKKGAPK